MDMVLSAVFGELVSRLISFIIEKSQAHVTGSSNDKMSRLQMLLLRAGAVVEEADGRRVINRGILLQLKQLREAMCRGYYILDNPDKLSSRPNKILVSQGNLLCEMDNLEAALDGMKEFFLILMNCPPIFRQPYSTYMFMESCMFGRHAEKEQIINFLLHPSSFLDVLPVVGPCYVGKTTLVEHVCMDEAVRSNFSCILRFNSDELSNVTSDIGNDNRKRLGLSDGRCLIIVELVHDRDLIAWGKLYRSLQNGADSSKIILISRMDQVSSFGTVEAVRLARLHDEEFWYFFRVLAFGSANPYDHHPDLASIGYEIATEIDGYFTMTNIITKMLRNNMNRQFWRRTLWCVSKSMHMHILAFGEDPRHTISRRSPSYTHTFSLDGPVIFFSIHKYETGSMILGDIASMKTAEEVLINADLKIGEKFDVVTHAHIPPYHKHVAKCVVKKPKGVDFQGKCVKRKRDRQ